MLKKAGVLPFLLKKKRKGCIIMSASIFGPPRYTALAGRRDNLNKDIRQKIYVIIDQLSEARLSQALDFLEFLKTKEEIEATNELIDDKAFYNAIKKGLEEIEKGEVFAASEVIEDV